MKIDKDGLPFIAAATLPSAVALLGGRFRQALSLSVLAGAVTAFFRDPERYPDLPTAIDTDIVLAPADGKVMHAGPAQPGLAPPGQWLQVSIFLSLADVHINRAPYGGEVIEVTYHPGKYLAAFTKESAVENERTDITVRQRVGDTDRIVHFRQIVGLLARRIVTRIEVGDTIKTGQRIGLMKFGSRMDVFLPTDAPLLVAKGDRVLAGESVLARWPRRSADDLLGVAEVPL